MTTAPHPLAILLDAILRGLDRELNRQDGRLTDLPPLYGTGRKRGDLAGLKKTQEQSDQGARSRDAA